MVNVADVENAQKAWGEGVVAIAAAHSSEGDYVGRARLHVKSLYAYDISSVLFKPTFAIKEQFRPTFEGALSYFVAENGVCPEDKGFAIKGWTKVRFENENVVINGGNGYGNGQLFFHKFKRRRGQSRVFLWLCHGFRRKVAYQSASLFNAC